MAEFPTVPTQSPGKYTPQGGSEVPLCCASSFQRDANPKWSFWCQNTRVFLTFEAHKRAIFPLLEGKLSQVKCVEYGLHGESWPGCGSVLAGWNALMTVSLDRRSQDIHVGPGPSMGPSVYESVGLVMTLHPGAGYFSPQPFIFHRPVKWVQQIFIYGVTLVPGTG